MLALLGSGGRKRENGSLGSWPNGLLHPTAPAKPLHVSQPPPELLAQAGYEVAEMYEAEMCCGMGGSYSVKLPEISAPILERKLTNIKNTGAPLAVMDCPGCVMQIRGGLDQQNSTIKLEHTVQRLADELE